MLFNYPVPSSKTRYMPYGHNISTSTLFITKNKCITCVDMNSESDWTGHTQGTKHKAWRDGNKYRFTTTCSVLWDNWGVGVVPHSQVKPGLAVLQLLSCTYVWKWQKTDPHLLLAVHKCPKLLVPRLSFLCADYPLDPPNIATGSWSLPCQPMEFITLYFNQLLATDLFTI